ncbi:MAG: hypothetical protein A2Z99_00125 [Treponema sp. GWB1_62_6]|nr:MAG: hypothetical protein A2Z99_00125 [Treponema sp. GWB1_62_6]
MLVKRSDGPARSPAVADRPRDSHTQRPAPSSTFVKEDDGMTYNPFADAFKKMQDKKGKK